MTEDKPLSNPKKILNFQHFFESSDSYKEDSYKKQCILKLSFKKLKRLLAKIGSL